MEDSEGKRRGIVRAVRRVLTIVILGCHME